MTDALAMIFDGPGQPLRPGHLPLPELEPGELLVEVEQTTVCGSDLHTWQGHRGTPCPTVLGHEILGHVAAIGPGEAVRDLSGHPLTLGDRVIWSVAASCGDCYFCRHDLPQKCRHLFKYGHEPLDRVGGLTGGLATHVRLVPGTAVVRVATDLPAELLAPSGCATATVAAAWRVGGFGETVVVQGAGMLGLTATAMAGEAGAHSVIVVDPEDSRRAHALRFGATEAVAPEAAASLVAELTDGRGADVVLELSGAGRAVADSLELVRTGGSVVWVGAVSPLPPLPVDPESVVRRCLSLHGLHNYAPADLGAAAAFLTAHGASYPFAELVSARFPLTEAEAALRYATETRAVRVAVQPG